MARAAQSGFPSVPRGRSRGNRSSEAHPLSLSEAVILPEVAVGFHAERAAVLVTYLLILERLSAVFGSLELGGRNFGAE